MSVTLPLVWLSIIAMASVSERGAVWAAFSSESLQGKLEDIAEQQVELDVRMTSFRERLVAQFSAADSLIAQLNSTRDFVTQQLEALAPQNFNK